LNEVKTRLEKMFELRLGKPVCERRGGRVVYRGGLENRFR
jgi:hypothetical protein